jgi:hypothetical protein
LVHIVTDLYTKFKEDITENCEMYNISNLVEYIEQKKLDSQTISEDILIKKYLRYEWANEIFEYYKDLLCYSNYLTKEQMNEIIKNNLTAYHIKKSYSAKDYMDINAYQSEALTQLKDNYVNYKNEGIIIR